MFKSQILFLILLTPNICLSASIPELLGECDVSDTKGKGGTFNRDCIDENVLNAANKLEEIVNNLEQSDKNYSEFMESLEIYSSKYCEIVLDTSFCGSGSCVSAIVGSCHAGIRYELIKKLSCLTQEKIQGDYVNAHIDKSKLIEYGKLCHAKIR